MGLLGGGLEVVGLQGGLDRCAGSFNFGRALDGHSTKVFMLRVCGDGKFNCW